MTQQKNVLTVGQAAKKLGISRQAVLKAINNKRIKAEMMVVGNFKFYAINKKELRKLK